MNFHVASSLCVCVGGGGGFVINFCFPARGGGGSCFNCSNETIKKNSRALRSLCFYCLNSYQAN